MSADEIRRMEAWSARQFPKLDVRPYEGVVTASGLVLHDRATGESLPGQEGGHFTYGVNDVPRLTVTFIIDGDMIRLGNHTPEHAASTDSAMEEAHAANDLQAALRAFSGLTQANVARFVKATGLGAPAQNWQHPLAAEEVQALREELTEFRFLRDEILLVKPERRDKYSLIKLVKGWQAEAKRLLDTTMFGGAF
jgi:hypothetical protein